MSIRGDRRREVAARLREYDVAEFKESAIVPFLECLGYGYKDWRGILDELADLIDRPTCKNESGYKDIFLCSECGARLEVTAEEGNEYGDIFHTPFQPRFCPLCGAEVVDDD